jgi:hypothetical protein
METAHDKVIFGAGGALFIAWGFHGIVAVG